MLESLEKSFKVKVLRFEHYSLFKIKADDSVLQPFALIIWQLNFIINQTASCWRTSCDDLIQITLDQN